MQRAFEISTRRPKLWSKDERMNGLSKLIAGARENASDMRLAFRNNLREILRDLGFKFAGVLISGCRHRHLSWPVSGEQVCLDCATRWKYDWNLMRRLSRAESREPLWILAPGLGSVAARKRCRPAPHTLATEPRPIQRLRLHARHFRPVASPATTNAPGQRESRPRSRSGAA
ncbi:MAG: hypothetical protein ACRD2F_05185 [Terriglobales bacterium]